MIRSVTQARPLYDNRADRRLFVEPNAWGPLMRAVTRGYNALLAGARGSGKTTLLRQAQLFLREQDQPVAFVDGTSASGVGDLVGRIRDALTGRPAPVSDSVALLKTAFADSSPPPGGHSQLLHGQLTALAAVPKTVVLVDASGSADAVYGLFGRLRDALWQLPHSWVVAVDDHERPTALKPPADAFFDVIIDVEPMSSEDLGRLLELREPDAASRTRDLVASAVGNPRAAIRALNDAVVYDREPLAGELGRAALLDAASRLGRPHRMVMAELLERGQASPSDRALQTALGLSRARITQLLRELLERGLVSAATERADGPGRPRTVYRPVRTPA